MRCSRRSARPATATGPRRRLHLLDRGVRRAVPGIDSRRLSSHAAHFLRRAEGDRERRCSPITPGAGILDGVGIRLPSIVVRPGKPNKAASGFFSGIIREPLAGVDAQLPVSETVVHTHASPRSAIGFLMHAAGLARDALGPRINLTMPGVCCTVADQIASLRRIAGERVAARIRREPDPLVARIVDGWPQRIEARRATRAWFQGRELVRRNRAHPHRRRPRRHVCELTSGQEILAFSPPVPTADRERVVIDYLAPITSRTAAMISGGNENALA